MVGSSETHSPRSVAVKSAPLEKVNVLLPYDLRLALCRSECYRLTTGQKTTEGPTHCYNFYIRFKTGLKEGFYFCF